MLLELLANPEATAPRQRAGQVLETMIKSAQKAKERFNNTAGQLSRYCYADDYNFEYQSLPDDSFFRARVSKTAEALQIFGPALYAKNPHRLATPRPFSDPQALARSEVMGDYLNYTMHECNFKPHARFAVDDSIVTGAGVLWTGFDKKKKLVTSKYESIDNILLDPDAIMRDEMHYVVRERVRPKWEVLKEYPQWAAAIKRLPTCKQRKSSKAQSTKYYQQTDQTAECVRYFEVYMNVGLHRYRGGDDLAKMTAAADGAGMGEADDTPLVYMVGDGGLFIGAREWEIPYFMDNTFPCEMIDYFHESNSIYPVSVLKNGMGFQKAINWIVTLLMGKYRFTSRSIIATMSQNGNKLDDGELMKILEGNHIEAIEVQANGDNVSINDFIQQWDWSHDYINGGLKLLDVMEQEFEKATGLYSILYTGEGQRQSRSAEDARIKNQRSTSRIDDMRDQLDDAMSRVARKEAMGARFLHTKNDIRTIFGEEYGQKWGMLIKPDAEVRQEYMMKMVNQGLPPERAAMVVDRLLQNAVSMESWLYESDYSVEAGSTQRKDQSQLIDSLKEQMNQTVPTQIQSMDPMEKAMAYHAIADYFKAIGLPDETVERYRNYAMSLEAQAMMPPPGMEPGVDPQGPPPPM